MKYQIGDTFIDTNSDKELRSSIFKIELEDNKIYYWFRYNSAHRDTYWCEEEIDEMLSSGKVKLERSNLKQEHRADKLEAKYENLLSHVKNVIGYGWDEASAEEIQSYLRYAIREGNSDYIKDEE